MPRIQHNLKYYLLPYCCCRASYYAPFLILKTHSYGTFSITIFLLQFLSRFTLLRLASRCPECYSITLETVGACALFPSCCRATSCYGTSYRIYGSCLQDPALCGQYVVGMWITRAMWLVRTIECRPIAFRLHWRIGDHTKCRSTKVDKYYILA